MSGMYGWAADWCAAMLPITKHVSFFFHFCQSYLVEWILVCAFTRRSTASAITLFLHTENIMYCHTAAVLLFINDGFQQQLWQIIFWGKFENTPDVFKLNQADTQCKTKTFPYHKLIPASNFAKFVWACEPCEMASVTETLSSSLWECKSKSWEMKARLGTQRTLRPHRGRINTAWFKSNGPRPARSQARIRDTGLISPRSSTHDTSSHFKTLQQYSKSSRDTLLF